VGIGIGVQGAKCGEGPIPFQSCILLRKEEAHEMMHGAGACIMIGCEGDPNDGHGKTERSKVSPTISYDSWRL